MSPQLDASGGRRFRIPPGELVRSRVVTDVATLLDDVLDDAVTGYATLVPAETLLLADRTRSVLTFEEGVPVLAYAGDGNDAAEDAAGVGGEEALAELAPPGPIRVELYELEDDALREAHEAEELRIAPGAPAAAVAGAYDLAERTRNRAPDDRLATDEGRDAVEAFLEDDERIAEIREQAREEAVERAEEWGFDDALVDD